MNRHLSSLALSAVIVGSALPVQAAIVPINPTPPIQIVVCAKTTDVKGLLTEYGLNPKFTYHLAFNGFAAPMDDATAAKLMSDPRVMSVELDGPIVPADQTVGTGLIRMGITNFPVAHIDGGDHRINVNVAVLDTGIQSDHPDLNVVQSVDETASGSNGEDWTGHGTHVAGIIGALDNHYGVVGVAPGVNLWDVEVLGPTMSTWTTVIAGIEYVLQNANQIEVVNCSLVGDPGNAPFQAIHGTIAQLVNAGIVVVAAAGNNTNDIVGPDGVFGLNALGKCDDVLPAALTEVMAVSAMNPTNDTIAWFSNFSQVPRTNNQSFFPQGFTNYVFSPGGAIDVAAPGVSIFSTWTNSEYAYLSGTSMACPHVTGLVALYIAAHGRATNAAGVYAIRQAIINESLAQSQWKPNGQPFDAINNPTGDPDTNNEPLAMPSENWVPQPLITSAGMVSGGFQVSFSAVPGYDYAVQSANTLGKSVLWTNISTISGSGIVAPGTVTDTNLNSSGFYRLSRQPSP